jgi:hypothetical protein
MAANAKARISMTGNAIEFARASGICRHGVAVWLAAALLVGVASAACDSADAPDGIDEVGVGDGDGDAQGDSAVDEPDGDGGDDLDVASEPDGSEPDAIADAIADATADATTDAAPDAVDSGTTDDPAAADAGDAAADASDLPSVCVPTGEAAHYWVGTLANRTTTTFAPDNPSKVRSPLTEEGGHRVQEKGAVGHGAEQGLEAGEGGGDGVFGSVARAIAIAVVATGDGGGQHERGRESACSSSAHDPSGA